MAVWLGKEFYAACFAKLLQFLYYLRSVNLELLHSDTRDRERYLEELSVFVDHFKQGIERRNIRTLSNLGYRTLVLIIVIIVMVGSYIKEAITFEMNNLMYLKI